jgi:hypothetical protein
MASVRYLKVKNGKKLGIYNFPSFSKTGSIKGMKNKFYGKNALLVHCGNYIYDVSLKPEIYNKAEGR